LIPEGGEGEGTQECREESEHSDAGEQSDEAEQSDDHEEEEEDEYEEKEDFASGIASPRSSFRQRGNFRASLDADETKHITQEVREILGETADRSLAVRLRFRCWTQAGGHARATSESGADNSSRIQPGLPRVRWRAEPGASPTKPNHNASATAKQRRVSEEFVGIGEAAGATPTASMSLSVAGSTADRRSLTSPPLPTLSGVTLLASAFVPDEPLDAYDSRPLGSSMQHRLGEDGNFAAGSTSERDDSDEHTLACSARIIRHMAMATKEAGARPFVQYEISVAIHHRLSLLEEDGNSACHQDLQECPCGPWRVLRRFSQFAELHEELRKTHARELQKVSASLPSKFRLPSSLAEEGADRQVSLDAYLQKLLSSPVIRRSEQMIYFFAATSPRKMQMWRKAVGS
jgi:hypothetical protein